MRGSERISSAAYNKTGEVATKDSTTKSADADNVGIKGTSKIKKVANSPSFFSRLKNVLFRKKKPLSDFKANIKSVEGKVVNSPTKPAYKENKKATKEYLQNQGYKGNELKNIMNRLKSTPNEQYSDVVKDIPHKEFQLLGYTSKKEVASDYNLALTMLKDAGFSTQDAEYIISHARDQADKKDFRESFMEIIDYATEASLRKQNHQQIGHKKKARKFRHAQDIFTSTDPIKTNKSTKTQVQFSDKNQVIEFDSADPPSFISKDVTSKQTPDLGSTPKETNYNLDDSPDKLKQMQRDLANLADEYSADPDLDDRDPGMEKYNDLANFLKSLPLSDQIQILSFTVSKNLIANQRATLKRFFYDTLTVDKTKLPNNSKTVKKIIKHEFSATDMLNSLVKARAKMTDSTQQGLEVLYSSIDTLKNMVGKDVSNNENLIDFLSQLSKEQVDIVLSSSNSHSYPEIAEIVRKHNPLAKGMNR